MLNFSTNLRKCKKCIMNLADRKASQFFFCESGGVCKGKLPLQRLGMKFWTVGELWSSLPRITQVVLWKMVNDFEYLDLFKVIFSTLYHGTSPFKPPFGRIPIDILVPKHLLQSQNPRLAGTGPLVFLSPPQTKTHICSHNFHEIDYEEGQVS